MISEPMMPTGMSRLGFLDSSEAVETASKPMYAKKTMDAPEKMPFQPLGAKPFQVVKEPSGTQLRTLKKRRPTAMKNTRMTSLVATMIVLKRVDSLTPTTSSQVSASTMRTAKRLKTTGWPNRTGAEARTSGGAPFGQV